MNRTRWLAAFALILAPSMTFAQQGQMMGGRGGGMGGMAGMMQGQMGGGRGGMGGMGGGMGGMGGMMMASGGNEVRRAAKVELEGGRNLSGHIDLGTVVISSDLGQYAIMPDKIKVIRFLKPANEAKPAPKPGEDNAGGVENAEGPGAGFGDPAMGAPMIRAKVITTSDQEITGIIQNPASFRLELGFGWLIPMTDKLRTITFSDGERKGEAEKPAEGAAARAPEGAGPVEPGEPARAPSYFRQGQSIIVISPVGDRATIYNLESRNPKSLELSGTKDDPLRVTPIMGPDLVALGLRGSKITRIAVAETADGTWHPQELRKPFAGRAIPIIAPGLAVYSLGRDVYAYSAAAHRWDVVELPEGIAAGPVVGANGATIESRGHIYTFFPRTGKWEHIDVRAILDVAGAEPKK